MKYFKLFEDHDNDYVPYINSENCILPNLSYCKNQNETHLNKVDYSKCYLTFTARESGTISFNIWKYIGTDIINTISYSTDNGETWTTVQNQNNKEESLAINVNVNVGDEILWKGVATKLSNYDDDYVSCFKSTCEFDAKGNVMSLLYGDNFKNQYTIEEDGIFYELFADDLIDGACMLVNAKDLVLPATTLAAFCYSNMFYGCTSLTTAPELPTTTLAYCCYQNMFYGCTSLTIAPELPATTLAEACYDYMFYQCTSLTTSPELPATTLATYCYQDMFGSCTSLTSTPELSATTLAYGCYNSMFEGCTSLTTASELPATTLAENCYAYMFSNCTSLTSAPELPAITLADYCYQYMFYGCTSLNYIKAMFTTTPGTNYTENWVSNVASSGTFIKNSAA